MIVVERKDAGSADEFTRLGGRDISLAGFGARTQARGIGGFRAW